MGIKVLIIDDDLQCLNVTEDTLRLIESVSHIEKASCLNEVLPILRNNTPDVVLLDIELGNDTGFEVAQYIKSTYPEIPYIFLTGHAEFALKGYEFSPVDFLTKPVSVIRLKKALDKIAPVPGKDTNKKIGIMVNGGFEVISTDDISYFEKKGRHVFIHKRNGTALPVNYNLVNIENMFKECNLFRCHQSFLVSLDVITGIKMDALGTTYWLSIKDSPQLLPVSRKVYPLLKKELIDRGISFI